MFRRFSVLFLAVCLLGSGGCGQTAPAVSAPISHSGHAVTPETAPADEVETLSALLGATVRSWNTADFCGDGQTETFVLAGDNPDALDLWFLQGERRVCLLHGQVSLRRRGLTPLPLPEGGCALAAESGSTAGGSVTWLYFVQNKNGHAVAVASALSGRVGRFTPLDDESWSALCRRDDILLPSWFYWGENDFVEYTGTAMEPADLSLWPGAEALADESLAALRTAFPNNDYTMTGLWLRNNGILCLNFSAAEQPETAEQPCSPFCAVLNVSGGEPVRVAVGDNPLYAPGYYPSALVRYDREP